MRHVVKVALAFALVIGVNGPGCDSGNTSVVDAGTSDGTTTASGGANGTQGGATGGSGGAAGAAGDGSGAGGTGGSPVGGAGGSVTGGAGGSWFDPPDGPLACNNTGCPSGQFCAMAAWNGLTNVNRCLPLPAMCADCECALAAFAAYYSSRFPPPQALPPACSCWDATGHDTTDGGTGPVARVGCTGA